MINNKDVFSVIEKSLAKIRFKKKTSGIFYFQISTDIIGYLGINTAIFKIEKVITVNPVFGFLHRDIQMLAVELTDNAFKKDNPPLLFQNIGYIMPQKTYITWSFNGSPKDTQNADNVAEAITKYGIPWINHTSNLENCLIELRDNKKGLPGQREYKIPIVLHYLGRSVEGREFIEDFKKEMEINNTPQVIVDRYYKFSEKFSAMLK